MSCACKVNQQLSYIERRYGTKNLNTPKPKTDITGAVKRTLKKSVIGTMLILISPVMLLYMGGRSIITRKPFIMDNFFSTIRKSKSKNAGN